MWDFNARKQHTYKKHRFPERKHNSKEKATRKTKSQLKDRNLKESESRKIEEWNNVQSCANGKQQFEFVNRMLKVTPEAQAPYLEERL